MITGTRSAGAQKRHFPSSPAAWRQRGESLPSQITEPRRTTPIALFTLFLLGALLSAGTNAKEDTTGSASTAVLEGEQAFAACAACHSLSPGAAHRVGPNLHGIVGAPAAAAEGYRYSPALSEAGLVWTRETLFAWISGSEALVPGSWMLYHNLLSGEEVLNLIDYLETTSR